MNVLIIGGSRFIGRQITNALLARGHSVTHFNRGRSGAPIAGVTTIHGDRNTDLRLTGNGPWDAVIDTCAYTPDSVERSVRYFDSRTNRYLFISTISVYDESRTEAPDEDAPLQVLPADADPTVFDVRFYGALKVLCELVVRSAFRSRATIVRPGLVAGPLDPTDRFTYWPVRADAGGTVLAPVSPSEPVQYIDVRDLAQFAVHALECDDGGTYNCVIPPGSCTFGALTDACERAAHSGATYVWVPAEFLREHGVEPWSDLPLWIPAGDSHRAIVHVRCARALVRGLQIRSVQHTVRDTLEWAQSSGKRMGGLSAGLDPAREAALLHEYEASLTAAVK
ncbi:MAG TPA: NAD-dependent epimerase/dehydratase family protein [Candidatus Baltobacteraceae bacterium]|nr:NAD-dependent epimerase/dehydratase family protein [Candidatus Baltobacteraceae bacterium]